MADCTTCQDCTQPPVGPVCPAPPQYTANSCPTSVLSDCVDYTGPDLSCFGIASTGTPNTITTVLKGVFSYLSTLFTRITSSSLAMNVSGACANQLSIEVVPSSQSGNTFILGTDGRPYVPQTMVNMQASKCITWVSSGTPGGILWTPILDFTCVSSNITSTAIQCAAPSNVSISNIATNGATITFATTPGLTYDLLINNNVSATGVTSPYTFSGLNAGTNYTAAIRVNCASGASSETIVSFTTQSILTCNNPTDLQITSV